MAVVFMSESRREKTWPGEEAEEADPFVPFCESRWSTELASGHVCVFQGVALTKWLLQGPFVARCR